MDKYKNFKALERQESGFRIEVVDRGSDVTIIAPHGGRIEPHTAEIAALIAGAHYNLFTFHGLKQNDNYDLHITSHRFDHPLALELVSRSRHVVAVHGCTDREPVTYLGGLDTALIKLIIAELIKLGMTYEYDPERFGGTHQHNICNRGRFKRGVQLELSRGIRDSNTLRSQVSAAVRSALGKKTGRGKGVTSPVNARNNG